MRPDEKKVAHPACHPHCSRGYSHFTLACGVAFKSNTPVPYSKGQPEARAPSRAPDRQWQATFGTDSKRWRVMAAEPDSPETQVSRRNVTTWAWHTVDIQGVVATVVNYTLDIIPLLKTLQY